MPNWITNYVEIKGEPAKIDELTSRCLKQAEGREGQYFDFNGVIPMPESLNIIAGSTTDIGLAAFQQVYFDRFSSYPWFSARYGNSKSPSELREFLEASDDEQRQKELEAGKQASQNIAEHGQPTWYEWALNNWGTKWNATETEVLHQSPGRLVISFETAWSSPEPIFDRLVEEGFEVNCAWYDEDPSNEGEYGQPWDTFSRYHETKIEFDG